MKKSLLFLLLTAFITVFLCGCFVNPEEISQIDSDISEESLLISDETSLVESIYHAEEVYDFLNSKYTVTSTKIIFEKNYVCEYYFVDGHVVGAKLLTTLESVDAAVEYYNTIVKEYEDAQLEGCTVTHYLDDDDNFYYGYSLRKLKFVLEKTGYEYTINFAEADFYSEFGNVKAID